MALIGLAAALAVSLIACGVVFILGPRLGILDLPDEELKTHTRPIVPLGGVGVILGLHVGLWAAGVFDAGLLVSTLVVWMIGLADDLRGLSPGVRLLGCAVAGLTLALMSDVPGGMPHVLILTVATVVVVNAVNLIDGIDGLAGTVAVASLSALWWFGTVQGAVGPDIFVVSIGAILGFLYWNLHPARMFLGDNGAYVIGVTLTWAALRASPDTTAGVVGLAIIGVPILDMAVTVARRMISRRGVVSGDRDHTYDRLVRSGISVGVVVSIYVLAEAVWATIIVSTSILAGDLVAILAAVVLGSALVLTAAIRQSSGHVV